MRINLILALSLLHGGGIQAARVILVLYALELGAGAVTVGVLGATFSVFPVLLAVSAGRLSDRFGALWPMLAGAVLGGVGMLVPYLFPGLTSLFVATALCGLSSMLFNVSTQNLVGVLSGPDDRARNFSNYSLVNAITSFIGPLLAGYSVEHAGYPITCLYIAVFCASPIPVLGIWRRYVPAGTKASTRRESGSMSILKSRGVRGTLVASSLQDTGDILFQFYMPVYAHAMGLSASAIGIILAMKAGASFIMRLILPQLIARYKEERLLMYAFYAGTAALIVVPFFQDTVTLSCLSFLFGLSMGSTGPIITMLMFANAPPGRSGEALGMRMTVNHMTKIVTPVFFGVVASAFGLSPVFWINATMLAAGGVVTRPRTPVPTADDATTNPLPGKRTDV